VEVIVDGQVPLSAPADGGAGAYGGFGLSCHRGAASTPCPTFTELSVTAGPDLPNVHSGVGVLARP
jgi:poly-beta-1,6-N-acetyl-D-glucosamine N-deacetylase